MTKNTEFVVGGQRGLSLKGPFGTFLQRVLVCGTIIHTHKKTRKTACCSEKGGNADIFFRQSCDNILSKRTNLTVQGGWWREKKIVPFGKRTWLFIYLWAQSFTSSSYKQRVVCGWGRWLNMHSNFCSVNKMIVFCPWGEKRTKRGGKETCSSTCFRKQSKKKQCVCKNFDKPVENIMWDSRISDILHPKARVLCPKETKSTGKKSQIFSFDLH